MRQAPPAIRRTAEVRTGETVLGNRGPDPAERGILGARGKAPVVTQDAAADEGDSPLNRGAPG
jgi:hypothetical protein